MALRDVWVVVALAVFSFSRPAAAQDSVAADTAVLDGSNESAAPSLALAFAAAAATTPLDAAQTAPPPRATEYSDAYRLRAKIHKISSFATLPLFGTEAVLGQSLYSNPTSAKRTAHLAVAGGIGALFGVNTVTGVWNLMESRKDPNDKTRRMLHGILMLGADAGFLATAAMGPSRERFGFEEGSPSAHRAMAFTAIGTATAGYLVMLFGHH